MRVSVDKFRDTCVMCAWVRANLRWCVATRISTAESNEIADSILDVTYCPTETNVQSSLHQSDTGQWYLGPKRRECASERAPFPDKKFENFPRAEELLISQRPDRAESRRRPFPPLGCRKHSDSPTAYMTDNGKLKPYHSYRRYIRPIIQFAVPHFLYRWTMSGRFSKYASV